MAEGITQLAEAGEKGGRAGLQQPRCRERRLEKAGGQWAGLHLPFQEQAAAQICSQLCPRSSHCASITRTTLSTESLLASSALGEHLFIHPLIHTPLSFNYPRPTLTLLSALLSLD